jgi:MerR family mercuric resistance operon transcriptional regulator
MRIGELAVRTGIKIETIRYYERIGLFPVPPRTMGGLRFYSEGDARRLSFIRRSRELGFTLEDVRTLMDLADRKEDCAARELALKHLEEVRGKIGSLRKLERALRKMTEACAPSEQTSCPIFDALSGAN